MKVWHSSTTEHKPCVKCGRMTGTRKVYEQTNIEVKIPLCDNEIEKRHCYNEVSVEFVADVAIKLLKREITG